MLCESLDQRWNNTIDAHVVSFCNQSFRIFEIEIPEQQNYATECKQFYQFDETIVIKCMYLYLMLSKMPSWYILSVSSSYSDLKDDSTRVVLGLRCA